MRKITVCGACRLNDKPKGGQEIKTCILATELERKYKKIHRIDTLGKWSKLKNIFQLIVAVATSYNIIILPAHKGLIVEALLLRTVNFFFRRNIFYVVIGGWLSDYLQHHSCTANNIRCFKGIFVETNTMKNSLEKMGYTNIFYMPNFKPLEILNSDCVKTDFEQPYPLVTFSRVTAKKGIETAVCLISQINKEYGKPVFTLDIYGTVDTVDEPWFSHLKSTFTDEIKYKGNVAFNKSPEVLSKYFALLFPTEYYTEGVPGTIIDAYAAGLPVISSRWKSFNDVVIDKHTGYGYQFGNTDELRNLLLQIAKNPNMIISLKKNCLHKAKSFLPENAMRPLINLL